MIRLVYSGVEAMWLREDGALVLETELGKLIEAAPIVYQEIDGQRVEVDGGYYIVGEREVSFALGAYDTRLPLVIDPVLAYSTYLGGDNGGDAGSSIAVDGEGNAYVTGNARSTDFPTVNPFQPTSWGYESGDAFVTKLNAAGSALVYSTYLGGTGGDFGTGIAVDTMGNAYVTGGTGADDFPTTEGAFQQVYDGKHDAFVTKLSPTGLLIYSTYLGGSEYDVGSEYDDGFGIAIDTIGSAYVTGRTGSPDFPTTEGAFQESIRGYDAFVTKLNPAGSALVYSTFLGGSTEDGGQGIAIDAFGNAYVTGHTDSTNFPTASAFQTSGGGSNYDAFVAKLNPAGSALVYSTYLGGSNEDSGQGIAVDTVGNAYVTGHTDSTNFPTASAFQTSGGGLNDDAFVAKFNPAGSALVYSTFLGGSNEDRGQGIAVDTAGNAYVTGYTESSDFPKVYPFQPTYGGDKDAFVAKFNATGSTLVYSSHLGGSEYDEGCGIAVDTAGNVYLTGETDSDNFPTANPFQPMKQGEHSDVFVTKIFSNAPPTANAGPDQAVEVNTLVRLYGSDSFDPDSDSLSLFWKFLSTPAGSTATLSDPNSATPTFIADVLGQYILKLTVEDGQGKTDSDQVTIRTLRTIVINEVAYMGTQATTYDEWMELYNNTDLDIDVSGWTLSADDGIPNIVLSGIVSAHAYFLLERTDDTTVSDILADQIYTGVLENDPTAETLFLKDPLGHIIDTANGNGRAWPEGDNPTKSTMERIDPLTPDSDANWATNDGTHRNGDDADGKPINGTPKARNSGFNSPSIAGAGPDQLVSVGDTVTLDGSGSSDSDPDDLLSYSWIFLSKPVGSLALLSHPRIVKPIFVADVAGDYILELSVQNGCWGTDSDQVTITANVPPTAGFAFSPTEPTTRDVVQFTDQSSDSDGTVILWNWDFGDETTSTDRNPSHQYGDAGTYSVTLTVTDDDGGTDELSHEIIVEEAIGEIIQAIFAFSPTEPTTRDVVQFTDQSSDSDGTVTSWDWDFGDEATCTDCNPSHQYGDAGTYSVTLTVTDDDGDTDELSHEIIVEEAIGEIIQAIGEATDINGPPLRAGDTVTYKVTIRNLGAFPQPDDPDRNEFEQTIPGGISYVPGSAQVTRSSASSALRQSAKMNPAAVLFVGIYYDPGTDTIYWNGSIPAGEAIVIEYQVTIDSFAVCGTVISFRGSVWWDEDGDGMNDSECPLTTVTLTVEVGSLGPGGVMARPNPVGAGGVIFTFPLPEDTDVVWLKIYDIDGVPLFSQEILPDVGTFPIVGTWDPQDDLGRPLGNGLYLYIVIVRHTNGRVSRSRVYKLVVAR